MRNRLVAATLFALVALSVAVEGSAEMTPPSIVPNWISSPPAMSKRLDENAWERFARAGAFTADGSAAQTDTTARIAYDGKNFYVLFECTAPLSSMTAVTHQEDNQPVWQDESVELYIAPWDAPDDQCLYQFVVNAVGAKTALRAHEIVQLPDWTAQTSRTPRGWSAMMRIPLAVFTEHGTNEGAWRIAFCRNAKQHEESSSWPDLAGRFANFWRYARLLPPPGHPTFLNKRADLVPIASRQTGGGTVPLRQAAQRAPAAPLILPEPVYQKFARARFSLTPDIQIAIGQGANYQDERAAVVIADWVQQKAGFRPLIVRLDTAAEARATRRIVVGEPWLNPLSAALLRRAHQQVSSSEPGKEGYVVEVTSGWAVVAGSDQAGTFWGAQTLAQMIQTDGSGRFWIACGLIKDKPAMHFRSVHLLTAKDTLTFQSRLIRNVLSPLKINYVILQLDNYDWQSHPEVDNASNEVSPQDLRKLIRLARDYHITYIPLVPSLGHMEWIFRNGAHKDIAEDPNHPYAYCPLKENSYKLMYDLFDEAYALFGKPAYFHIGHDEFDLAGQFPYDAECKKLGKVELYYRDTLRLVRYLKQKGVRTIMWGDILQKPGFRERLDELPKDVIIADWHYSPNKDYPSVDFFQRHGHQVIACTWYNPSNIYYFSKYAYEHKSMGMMQTTWSGWQTADVVMSKWPEQMYQYVSGAAWAWSPGRPPLDSMSFDPEEVFLRSWLGHVPDKENGRPVPGEMFSVTLGPWANATTVDGAREGWAGLGSGEDFSSLKPGIRRLGSVTYRVMSSAQAHASAIMLRGPEITRAFPLQVDGIHVGSTAKQFWFLQTTGYPDGPKRVIGHYVVHYQDASEVSIPLIYGQNVTAWTDDQPAPASETAWKGRTAHDNAIRLKALCWNNPDPDKPIRSIDFVGEPATQAAPVLLAITGIR